jgi:hypothetical protein
MSRGHDFADHRHGHLERRLAAEVEADRRAQLGKVALREPGRLSAVRSARAGVVARPAGRHRARRGQGGHQGGVVELHVVAADGDGGPGVQADRGQGLVGGFAAIGDVFQGRRRGRALGADQERLEAGLSPEAGHRQGGRVAAQHDQAGDRIEGALEGSGPQGLGLLDTQSLQAVADPEGRRPGLGQVQQGAGRRVVGFDLLDQDLDPRAAQQADVRPGAAVAIDEAPRLAVGQAGRAWTSTSASMQPPDKKPETIFSPNTICAPIGRGPPPPSPVMVARAAGPRDSAIAKAGRASSAMPCMGQGRVV